MTLPSLGAWSPQAGGVLAATWPALTALAIAGIGTMFVRKKWAAWAGLPGAAGTLAGWLLLFPPALGWRVALWPRTMPEHLLAPAVVVLVLAAVGPRLRGRLAWWGPVGGAALIGWWLAGSPGGRAEFWRAWAAFALVAALLVRIAAGQVVRVWAAALAACAGLAAAGAPLVGTAGLVLAAAWTPAALTGTRSRHVPALLAAAFLVMAVLALGRLPAGGLNGADLACLLALAAPAAARALEGRMGRRLRRFGPVPAALAAAAVMAALAWAGGRVLAQ